MFQVITLPATGTDTDQAVFATALAVAHLSGAHLCALHVQADVNAALAAMMSAGDGLGSGFDRIAEDMERDVAARRQRAEQMFRDFCARHAIPIGAEPGAAKISAQFHVETGDEAQCLAEYGRTSDLIVLGREREGAPVAFDVLETALMTTGRPILITPSQPATQMVETVVIGWKNHREAARAVAAAQPIIALARRVIVMTVDEEGAADHASCERLCHALRWHNRQIEMQRIESRGRAPADAMLDAAGIAGAGILIVGGYGHGRLREMVFGGFTRRLLEGADIPILMAH